MEHPLLPPQTLRPRPNRQLSQRLSSRLHQHLLPGLLPARR